MITEEQVRDALDAVLVPGVMRSVVGLGLLRQVSITRQKVEITLASTGLSAKAQDWVREKVTATVSQLSGSRQVEIKFVEAKPDELNQVGHIIAIMSGKGGVGKSLVASLLAVGLRRQGYEVGILDADITGPSIPTMFGVSGKPFGSATAILPVLSRSGIEVMSINLLLPAEEKAVIWRGPLISRTITQFWEDVLWGKLDYLIVDLPPGTADASLTVLHSIPIDGVILVFTPQSLTTKIVKKAIDMTQQMNKPVLGVVENMSYFYVPELDKKLELFGESKGEAMAQAANAPLLARLPIDPELAKLCDGGSIERYDSAALNSMVPALVTALEKKEVEVKHKGGK